MELVINGLLDHGGQKTKKIRDNAMMGVTEGRSQLQSRNPAKSGTTKAPERQVIGTKEGSLAGTTGLEPATSDVTGRRSNQLSYVPAMCRNFFILTRAATQIPTASYS